MDASPGLPILLARDVLLIAVSGPAASLLGTVLSAWALSAAAPSGVLHGLLWAATAAGVVGVLNLVPLSLRDRRDDPRSRATAASRSTPPASCGRCASGLSRSARRGVNGARRRPIPDAAVRATKPFGRCCVLPDRDGARRGERTLQIGPARVASPPANAPTRSGAHRPRSWAGVDSNHRATDYESAALTPELPALKGNLRRAGLERLTLRSS